MPRLIPAVPEAGGEEQDCGEEIELAIERHWRDYDGQQPGRENAERSSDEGENEGLDEELHQDVTRASADGF